MQFIRDIYAKKMAASQPVISFEFFPPKTDEGDRNLFEKAIPALRNLRRGRHHARQDLDDRGPHPA